jgi:hypothetical protein
VKLDDVIVEPGDNLKVIYGYSFLHEDEVFSLPCPFAHLLQLEQRIFLNEKRLKMK